MAAIVGVGGNTCIGTVPVKHLDRPTHSQVFILTIFYDEEQ